MTVDVISRAAWGAKAPKSRQLLPTISMKGMALHYSAAEADRTDDPDKSAARVRAIQRYHMDTNGWADIAYSFIVDRHGQVFEGRGWDIRTAANGTNNANDYWMAVCFLGADKAGRDDVTEAGRRAIRAVCDECERRYPGANQHKPHSSFKPTACPGDELRGWLARGMPLAAPTPPKEVSPMISPPIDVLRCVAVLKAPGGGVWQLTEAGAIYAWECPDHDAPNRHPEYWHPTQKAARLETLGDGYAVIDSQGQSYEYPG